MMRIMVAADEDGGRDLACGDHARRGPASLYATEPGRYQSANSDLDSRNQPSRGLELREDRDFYIPQLLSDDDHELNPEYFAAAEAYAGNLRTAERLLDEILNLSKVLRAAMSEAGDSRAMQVDTILKIVEKKLTKVHRQIDKHDTRFLNLFMAYFELREKSTSQSP